MLSYLALTQRAIKLSSLQMSGRIPIDEAKVCSEVQTVSKITGIQKKILNFFRSEVQTYKILFIPTLPSTV